MTPPPTRLFADRRHGVDRRREPRRRVVSTAPVERRQVVDRRRGAERRSTLERRGRKGWGAGRTLARETPAEHVRNALQVLAPLPGAGEPEFAAALARLKTALELLEQIN